MSNRAPRMIFEAIKGFHNSNLDESATRVSQSNAYRDLSTVCVIPSRGMVSVRVVMAWFNLMNPMNQKFTRVTAEGFEIGAGYSEVFEQIVNHEELRKWQYILTLEDDVAPPPDGLLKLYESITKYDVVSGLYWTKGEGGMPMIYGDPNKAEVEFTPQIPKVDQVQPARGLGMGFNLFKMELFRDQRLQKPWFKTLQSSGKDGQGTAAMTQDLFFYKQAGELGYKFACDTRVKCGHYDHESGKFW